MFSLNDVAFLFCLLLACYWVYAAFQVREIALQAVKQQCKYYDLQLLDQSISIKAVWFKRDSSGNLRFWRSYKFEFSSTGTDRYQGMIVMLGRVVTSVTFDTYRIPDDEQGSEPPNDHDQSGPTFH